MLDGLLHKKETKVALDVLTQFNVLKFIFIVIVKIEHPWVYFLHPSFVITLDTITWSFMFILKGDLIILKELVFRLDHRIKSLTMR